MNVKRRERKRDGSCVRTVCVCVHHSFYMVGSCVAIFMWICLGEENRHNIEDETPVKCAYGIIYFDSNVLLIFRLKVLPNIFIFLCVCSVLCFTFSRYVFFSLSRQVGSIFMAFDVIHMQILLCHKPQMISVYMWKVFLSILKFGIPHWGQPSTEWSITKQDFSP